MLTRKQAWLFVVITCGVKASHNHDQLRWQGVRRAGRIHTRGGAEHRVQVKAGGQSRYPLNITVTGTTGIYHYHAEAICPGLQRRVQRIFQ